MSDSINTLKNKALQVLVTESFRYINQVSYQDLNELARQNATIRGVAAKYFTYSGLIYPDKTAAGELVCLTNVLAPALHYSLYDEYDKIIKRTEHMGVVEVSNYFKAVLSYSVNGLVMDKLLPAVLVNAVRGEFTTEEYSLIDFGLPTFQIPRRAVIANWEPEATTLKNIEDIEVHYTNTIITLRDLLMNKLLLASA